MSGRLVGEDTVIASLYNSSQDLTEIQITNKSGTIIYPSSTGKSIQEIISSNLSSGKQYKERIVEITTGGIYRTAVDGTRVTITPGKVKVYIYYEEV